MAAIRTTFAPKWGPVDKTVDPGSVTATDTLTVTVTVTGAQTEDAVFVHTPSLNAGLGVGNAFVSAADTVKVVLVNATDGNIDDVSQTWTFFGF